MAASGSAGDILTFCKQTIQNELEKCIDPDGRTKDEVNVLRRNKDLKRGDFLAIVRSWKCNKRKSGKFNIKLELPEQAARGSGIQDQDDADRECVGPSVKEQDMAAVKALTFESLSPFKASLCELTTSHDILIKLQRSQVCAQVIGAVCEGRTSYGNVGIPQTLEDRKRACINVADLMDNADWPGFSVSHLRSLLLSDHVSALLQAAGYQVDFVKYKTEPALKTEFEEFDIFTTKYDPTASESSNETILESLRNEIHQSLRDSPYYVSLERQKDKLDSMETRVCNGDNGHDESRRGADRNKAVNGRSDMDLEVENIDPTVIDLKSFLQKKDIISGFDRNIKLADFSPGSDKLADLAYLELDRRSQNKACDVMVHIAPHEKSFYLQTVDIGWQILFENSSCAIKQVELIHGPVGSRGGQPHVFKAADLISLRRSQMKSASVMKYGDIVQGAGWDATIRALTVAGIKFEILSTSCRQPVKLDMSVDHEEGSAMTDNRGGVFVMYNCARLSNLISNYNKAVEQAMYPSLPSVDSLDFGLLREEEEWALIFNYLLPYPSLVLECVTVIEEDISRPQIRAHKISQFLQELSRDLSSYYSRVHVLGEPRPHLYPVMFCRLYLLKALQQVMNNALQLLNIVPLSQL